MSTSPLHFHSPFIPVLHSASTTIDQTSSVPVLESHKSLCLTDWRTKAQRDLRLNPTSFKQGNSRSPTPEAEPPNVPREGVAQPLGTAVARTVPGIRAPSPVTRGRDLHLWVNPQGPRKNPKGSCRTPRRIRPWTRKVLPMTMFQAQGIPKHLLIRK